MIESHRLLKAVVEAARDYKRERARGWDDHHTASKWLDACALARSRLDDALSALDADAGTSVEEVAKAESCIAQADNKDSYADGWEDGIDAALRTLGVDL